MMPVAAPLAAAHLHAAGAGGLGRSAARHPAFTDDELVLHVPAEAVLGNHPAHAIGWPPVAVDHEIAAILERYGLGRIAPDVRPFRRRPREAVILGDGHHQVLGIAARIDVGAHMRDQAAILEPEQRGLFIVDDGGGVVVPRRVVFPVFAIVVGTHQGLAHAFALALLSIAAMTAVVRPEAARSRYIDPA